MGNEELRTVAEAKDATHVIMPKWLVNAAIIVMTILLCLSLANLSLNFLDRRSIAQTEAVLEERGRTLQNLEQRIQELERRNK